MKNNNIDSSDLIFKYLIGDLSSQEEQDLNKWLENPYNKLQFDKICNSEKIDQKFEQHRNIDVRKDWKRVAKRTVYKEIKSTVFKYAAAIILPIGIFLAIYYTINTPQYSLNNELVIVEPVVGNQPLLILDNGVEHILSGKDTVLSIDNTNVMIGADNVLYNSKETIKPDSIQYNILKTPKGAKHKLTLADGSTAWLNAETTLKFPVQFTDEERKVFLIEGEAYFDVIHDAAHPFVVDVNSVNVKVLGTSFDIKAYKNEKSIQTVLIEGSVEMNYKENVDKAGIVLVPGSRGRFSQSEKRIVIDEVDTETYTAWKNDQLVFYDQRLEDIMRDLSRWYDFEIEYENNECKNLTFTADLERYSNMNVILEALEAVEDIQFILTKDKIYVKNR
ncbi:MAG: FecR domain-containing protein [Marinifilum sp.]|jgi:hypothetical protein|nr:FecR domain-containing protein [Marinifilum sp.]